MVEETERENTQKIERFIHFIDNVSPFYNLSYEDLSFIKKNCAQIPPKITKNIENIDEELESVKNFYKLDNYHYRQNYSNSCAIACYMMARSNYLKNCPLPNKKLEGEILKDFENNVSIVKILLLCLQENLNIKIFSELDYREIKFEEEWGEELRVNFLDFYEKNHKNKNIQFNFNQPLKQKLLKKLLMNGESILVNGLFYNIPHMRLVTGYNQNNFIIDDPIEYRKSQIGFSTLKQKSKPPLGQFFFSLTTKEINGE